MENLQTEQHQNSECEQEENRALLPLSLPFKNQHTFQAIRELIETLQDPVTEIELDDLVEWITEIEDLLEIVTELLDRARFFAFVRATSDPMDAEED